MSVIPNDTQLQNAINDIFEQYDTDNSGYLDFQEVKRIITDAFRSMNAQRNISDADVKKFLGIVDKNSDGRITKEELFGIFKEIIGKHYGPTNTAT